MALIASQEKKERNTKTQQTHTHNQPCCPLKKNKAETPAFHWDISLKYKTFYPVIMHSRKAWKNVIDTVKIGESSC